MHGRARWATHGLTQRTCDVGWAKVGGPMRWACWPNLQVSWMSCGESAEWVMIGWLDELTVPPPIYIGRWLDELRHHSIDQRSSNEDLEHLRRRWEGVKEVQVKVKRSRNKVQYYGWLCARSLGRLAQGFARVGEWTVSQVEGCTNALTQRLNGLNGWRAAWRRAYPCWTNSGGGSHEGAYPWLNNFRWGCTKVPTRVEQVWVRLHKGVPDELVT